MTAYEEQLAIVEDMIAEGVDYIIINPIDPEVQRVAYERVIDSGIPFIVGNYSVPFPDDCSFQPMMFSGYSHADAGLVSASNFPRSMARAPRSRSSMAHPATSPTTGPPRPAATSAG